MSVWLVAGLGLAAPAAADAPELLRFQGTLEELASGPVADGTYTVRGEIFDVATGGEPLYSQEVPTQVVGGAYTLVLAPDTAGELADALDAGPRFLQVTVVSGPGVSAEEPLLPRQELASVPFALEVAEDSRPSAQLWSASRTDFLLFDSSDFGGPWKDIPGMEVTFDLEATAKLHISADGVQRATPDGMWCHQSYRILIDGVPVSPTDENRGQRIVVSRENTNHWTPWSLEHSTEAALHAGSHTVRVQTLGSHEDQGCIVCGEYANPGGNATSYTNCELAVQAFYE